MAVARIVVIVVAAVIGIPLVAAAVLFATDYAIEAKVTGTDCTQGQVKVETKLLGIDHTVKGVDARACGAIQEGNFAKYHVRSHRTVLYREEGGKCIYDSKDGCSDAVSSVPGILQR